MKFLKASYVFLKYAVNHFMHIQKKRPNKKWRLKTNIPNCHQLINFLIRILTTLPTHMDCCQGTLR